MSCEAKMLGSSRPVRYLHVHPNQTVVWPEVTSCFTAAVIVESPVTNDWRNAVAEQLVEFGCVWMCAWGLECSAWDDAVDWANLCKFDYSVPDGADVMTTWHERDALDDFLKFVKLNTLTDATDQEIPQCLLIHISNAAREAEIVRIYTEI